MGSAYTVMAETERQGKQYAKLGHRKHSHARRRKKYFIAQHNQSSDLLHRCSMIMMHYLQYTNRKIFTNLSSSKKHFC